MSAWPRWQQGIAPRQIHERVEQTLKQERFIDLGQGQRFTTKEIFHEIERKALETADRLGEKTTRVVRDRTIAREIAREPRLNDGQKAAIETVCRGPDLTYIQGPPGSGKSTLFEVARRAIEKDGGNVIGLTPSNRAARELEKSAGIESYTIHRFLYDRERHGGRYRQAPRDDAGADGVRASHLGATQARHQSADDHHYRRVCDG